MYTYNKQPTTTMSTNSVIGGWNNSRTIIRRQKRIVIFQTTNNVLSSDEPIEFTIEITSRAYHFLFVYSCFVLTMFAGANFTIFFFLSFADGEINIFREGEKIVEAFDQNPLDIDYVNLGNSDSNEIDYYYNCRENADFNGSDQLKGDLIVRAGVFNSRSKSHTPSNCLLAIHVIFYLIYLSRQF